ncbi:hypothetical protein LCGC14_1355030 [marine sediment metagenome]|uniref:Uncharacterized protein n=1 Tax=marine sediment metagenome TaxID=412755 RepID=A0A0F9K9R2_9ZZZZ
MSIAYDAASNSSQSTGNLTWDHTPSGTPKGVLVFVLAADNGLDEVTGVTYGGVPLVEVALSPLLKTTTVPLAAHAYFLGSSVPTGVQEVVVTVSNADSDRQALCYTVTSSQDSEVQNTATWLEEATTDPTATLALSGEECWVALTALSDSNSVGAISPLSGWTSNLEVSGFFSRTGYWYRYNTVGTSDVTIGYDGTELTDSIGIGVAIKEVAVGPTEETVTFTSNAILQDAVTETFTSNATLYGAVTETYLSNATLYGTVTETYTSNAHLFTTGTETETYLSNSILYNEISTTYLSNSVLYAAGVTVPFTTTSLLYDENTSTFTSNANLVTGQSFTSNAFLWTGITEVAAFTDETYEEAAFINETYEEAAFINETYEEAAFINETY